MAKNLCAKTRERNNPYEIWQSYNGQWTWHVLKKWQADDRKPYARWFCYVTSPVCPAPDSGEYGDVYVSDIMRNARQIAVDPETVLT